MNMADAMSAERVYEGTLDDEVVEGSVADFESAMRLTDYALERAAVDDWSTVEHMLIHIRTNIEYGLAWQAQGR